MKKRMDVNRGRKKILAAVAAVCLMSGGVLVYAVSDSKLFKHEDNPMFPASIAVAVQENGAVNENPVLENSLEWEKDASGASWSVPKKVQIANISRTDENNADAYIRVCMIPRWITTVGGQEVDIIASEAGLLEFESLKEIGEKIDDTCTYKMGDVSFTLDENWEQYWLFNPNDGYFYYRSIVSAGDVTEPLLAEVSVTQETWEKITETDADGTVTDVICLDVDILADSVQTVGGALQERWGGAGVRIDENTGALSLGG